MKNGLHFDDHDWRNGSASAYSDSRRGVIMVDYDDNLLFDDEVVGQAIAWPDVAPFQPVQRVSHIRAKSRRK